MKDNDFMLSFTEKDKQSEMKAIYERALVKCKTILTAYEEQWEAVTTRLLEKETLTGEEIERMIHQLSEVETEEEIR